MPGTKRLLFLLACGLPGVPLAADTVILKNGLTEITGAITGSAREIRIQTPEGIRSIPVEQVFSIGFVPLPATPGRPAPSPTTATGLNIPAETPIVVRTIDAIDSKTGDTYREYAASLDEPIVVNGVVMAPAKTSAVLKITEIRQAAKLKGGTTLTVALIAITINGQRIPLETGGVLSAITGKGKETVRDGAIGGAVGCGIGALAGGALGCGVGGAIGAAGGAVTSALTSKTVKFASETRLTFQLTKAVATGPRGSTAVPASGVPAAFTEALTQGDAHAKAGEYTEALKEYQTALDLNKRSSLAHYSVAQVFLQQGNLSAAANEFRMALNGDSDAQWVEAWAHIRLGQIFDRTNQRDRAINEYVLAARTGDDTDGAKRAIAEYQASLCHESVCSDFVRMKDGTGVTGNWLGSDGDRIQFLADDTPRTYTKAQVYSVLFGAGAPPAPSVAVTSSPAATSPPVARPVSAPIPRVVTPAPNAATQPAYGPDPEWVGAVYFRNEAGEFVPLQRNTATYMPVKAGVGYSPIGIYRDFYVLEGPRCSVRLTSSQKLNFVVRLANGVDPRVFSLYPLDLKKGSRITKLDQKKKILVTVPIHVTRAGTYSYSLLPDSALPAGEYAFSPRNSNDAYCFGIDP